jgi:hypothetical protein
MRRTTETSIWKSIMNAIKRFGAWLNDLFINVIANYIAANLDKFVKWFIESKINIIVTTAALFFLSLLIEFSRRSFIITGQQIIFGMMIGLGLIVTILNAGKIRRWFAQRRRRYQLSYSLAWLINEYSEPEGPYCPICRKEIAIAKQDEIDETLDDIFGEVKCRYFCPSCGFEKILPLTVEDLKSKVGLQINRLHV